MRLPPVKAWPELYVGLTPGAWRRFARYSGWGYWYITIGPIDVTFDATNYVAWMTDVDLGG